MSPKSIVVFTALSTLAFMARAELGPIWIEKASELPSTISGDWDAAAKTSIDVDQAQAAGITSLEQLLSRQPSMQVRQIGGSGSYSDLSFRGSSADQVLVYLDGLLLNNATVSAIDLSLIPLESLQSVEIYRHQLPVDSQAALGTVVHLRSKSGGAHDQLQARLGTFGERQWAYAGRRQLAEWRSSFQLYQQRADNDFDILNDQQTRFNPYDDVVEPRRNNAAALDYAQGQLRYQVDHLQALELGLSLSDKSNQLPNRLNSSSNHAQFDQQHLGLRGVWQRRLDFASNHSQHLAVSLQQQDEHFLDRDDQIGIDGQDNDYQLQRLSLSLTEQDRALGSSDNWRLATHLQFDREDFRSVARLKSLMFAENTQIYQRDSLTLSLLMPWSPEALSGQLTPSLQWQSLRDSSPSRSQEHSQLLQYGLSWSQPWQPAWLVEINLNQREKAPGFTQRYADHGLSVGNPDLLNERSQEISLTLMQQRKFELGGMALSQTRLDAYSRRYRDLIVNSYDSQGIGRFENLGDSRIAGLEWQGRIDTSGDWQWDYALSVNRNIAYSEVSAFDQKHIPNTPRREQSVQAQSPWWGSWRGFYRLHRQQGVFYDRANLLPRANETQHDLGLRYQLPQGHLQLSFTNINDQPTEAFNGYPGPGRAWSLEFSTAL